MLGFLSTPIPVAPFLLIMVLLILWSTFISDSGKADIIQYRKDQTKNSSKNTFRVKFQEDINKRVKYSKREEIELLALNAGFDLSYSDYLLICACIAIGLLVIFTVILNNVYMGFVFAFVGFIAPKQVLGVIKHKRLDKIEKQIGPFMKMVIKRYEYTGDFEMSLTGTAKEFYGTEPLFSELSKTVSEISIGVSIPNALDNLARRTSNRYLGLLADYYKIAYTLGTDEVRKKLLNQAYQQYEENRKMKAFLKEQISEPVRDSYLMVLTVPVFFLVGCFGIDGYLDFMTHEMLGQISLAVISLLLIGIIWFINKVVGAPLEKKYDDRSRENKKK